MDRVLKHLQGKSKTLSQVVNVTPQPMAETSGRDTERNRLSRSFHNNYNYQIFKATCPILCHIG
ncbi:hypothetical protein HanRHA438_Chr14g0661311 [Helianthus annuus]|nr:hypothetical protein HanRHA438_Chr14g0661311 [Helianthus annuus]